MNQQEIYIKSSLDGTIQPSLFYQAVSEEKRPLLVGLHTWSYDRFNQIKVMLPYAEKYNFHLLLPEFRGNNLKTNPNCVYACGSEYAKQDIKDAIDHVIEAANVDTDNIFLLGCSGGGHMSLLMAGFCPEYFRAIGAFVPITDLKKWTEQNKNYSQHVFACCGTEEEELNRRSPVYYIDTIAKSNTKIFHGKRDSVVPVSHSITFYNQLLDRYPEASVYLDIFDGRHEIDMEVAMYWLLSQYHGENMPQAKKQQVTG